MNRGHAALAAIALLASTYGCGASDEEVKRIPSPDGVVEAVIVLVHGGATVALFHDVYIVPKGARTQEEHRILKADRVDNLRVVWAEVRQLSLCFDHARIFNFTNFWHSRDVQNFNYVVNIRLVQSPERAAGC